MPLLVDCYNVLFTTMPPVLAGLDEARLCQLLGMSPWARGGVVVVCDGKPKPTSPDPDAVLPIELIYSGSSRSADDVIIEKIKSYTAPRRLTVVSNDRQIQKATHRRRCRVLSTERFIQSLERIASQRPRLNNAKQSKSHPTRLNRQEIHNWLQEFGIQTEGDEIDDKIVPEDPSYWDEDDI